MSPVDLSPAYYQAYNLVGETPDILVASSKADNNPIIMMPEIVVTATRIEAADQSINFPEIIITAPSIKGTENMQGVIMMPEIVVTAKKAPSINIGSIKIKHKTEKEG